MLKTVRWSKVGDEAEHQQGKGAQGSSELLQLSRQEARPFQGRG